MIARCNLKMKQYTEAFDNLMKALAKRQDNSNYWCSLGILYAELDKVSCINLVNIISIAK